MPPRVDTLFPQPELTDPQYAVLRYLAARRRGVTYAELAGGLGMTTRSVEAILERLARTGFVSRDPDRQGRWGRVRHWATEPGRAHARAVSRAAALVAPLTAYGLTRRQATVLYVILAADGPLTVLQVTTKHFMIGMGAVRTALHHLVAQGLCYTVETRNLHDTATRGYLATDAARALINPDAGGPPCT